MVENLDYSKRTERIEGEKSDMGRDFAVSVQRGGWTWNNTSRFYARRRLHHPTNGKVRAPSPRSLPSLTLGTWVNRIPSSSAPSHISCLFSLRCYAPEVRHRTFFLLEILKYSPKVSSLRYSATHALTRRAPTFAQLARYSTPAEPQHVC